MRSFAIHIYNNAEAHKNKVEAICEQHGVKIGPLFETLVERMTDEEWAKYANMTKEKKGIGKTVRAKLAKAMTSLDDTKMDAVLAALREQGITLDN